MILYYMDKSKYKSGKDYTICKKVEIWLSKHKFYEKSITRKIIAAVLAIDCHSIIMLNVRNHCINVRTGECFYKIQIYSNNIKMDLKNRKLFYGYSHLLVSPIKIYRKKPLIIAMPILEKRSSLNEKASCYILDILKEKSYQTKFKVNDYPLISMGLSILGNYDYGKHLSESLYKYLLEQEGVIVRVGVVHGDFHRENIMFRGRMPLLIDFDCSRENDIQSIDALYYILEEVRHKNGYKRPWLDEWLLVYQNIDVMYEYKCIDKVDIDLKFGLIILFLERIAQEQKLDCFDIENYKEMIKKIGYKLDK